MTQTKTNAMRLLDSAGVTYKTYTYESSGAIDGVSVAEKICQPPERVFKTLVTQGASRTIYVFVIPVAAELDLKAASMAVGEKSVALIRVADINKVTGYIRGGCSPIGMKKAYTTVIDSSAEAQETIIFSAGKIGLQVEMALSDLKKVICLGVEHIAQ
ncbi:MAG: Cys-tRNA(Pro) deacylase [Eubacteriales bacterium]|nr:Cys-tRNA(Pro) deacylase [Eubacteriales bacterium]